MVCCCTIRLDVDAEAHSGIVCIQKCAIVIAAFVFGSSCNRVERRFNMQVISLRQLFLYVVMTTLVKVMLLSEGWPRL